MLPHLTFISIPFTRIQRRTNHLNNGFIYVYDDEDGAIDYYVYARAYVCVCVCVWQANIQ